MKLHCPECTTELNVEGISFERGEVTCSSCHHVTELSALVPPSSPAPELQQPEGSKVVVERRRPEEVTLYIPSRAGCFMIFFASFWNLFMMVFTMVLWSAGGPSATPWIIIPFLLLFWCVGLGLMLTALFSACGKTLVHVEPGSVAVKKQLFGRGWTRTRPLGPDASADLVAAYEQNEKPVYACAVRTGPQEVKFGSFLSDEEKAWLVDLLNDVLGAGRRGSGAEEATVCPGCGARLEGEDISLLLGLARCRRCNSFWGRDELASAPVSQPEGTRVALSREPEELRVVLPPLAAQRAGKKFLLFPLGFIVLGVVLSVTIGLPIILLAFFLGVPVLILVFLLSSTELVFRQGALEKETRLLGLRWRREMPLRRKSEVDIVSQGRPDQVRRTASPGPNAHLRLKHEGGELEFGHWLSPGELRWLKQEINSFLRSQEEPPG